MINKIQKYLLLHYPTLWNIKLFPMLLILIGVHALFGLIGYISGAIDFESSYYRRIPVIDDGYLFICTIFISIFIFIGWLIFYMRNNALKNFYPKKALLLYSEWLLIFVIITSIALIPFSTTLGAVIRCKSTASEKESRIALDIIQKSKMLAPSSNEHTYEYTNTNGELIPIPNNMVIDISGININLYDFEYDRDGKIHINGYRGPSLLFYKNDMFNYHYESDNKEAKEQLHRQQQIERVKKWLRSEQKDSIYSVMVQFHNLQKKHKLKITITPDEWLKRVYNPPFYPVDNNSVIGRGGYYYNDYYSGYNRYYDYENSTDNNSIYVIIDAVGDTIMRGDADSTREFMDNNMQIIPNLSISELEAAYEHILYTHTHNDYLYDILLVVFCVAIWISIFVFSYRVTSGKTWLIAFVSSGILFFFILFLGVLISEGSYPSETGPVFIFSLWLTIFISLMVYIMYKVFGSKEKGYSNAPMNIFLWLIPCIIPLVYFNYINVYDIFDSSRYRSFQESECIFWIDIVVVIIAMYPVSALVRKWKGIAEE